MKKKNKIIFLCSLLATLLMILPVCASATTVTFYCKDLDGNLINSSKMQLVTSTGTSRPEYTMKTGSVSVSLTAGTDFGFNMEADDYAKRYSSDSMFTVPSTAKGWSLKLTPKSTYQNYNYGSPLSSLSVTSQFGWRVYSYNGKYVRDCHMGIDYAGTDGVTDIKSISKAESYGTGWDSSSGNYLKVVSNSFTITYRHMNSYSTTIHNEGTVGKGTVIGKVGKTGGVTGAHLHIDIYSNGTYRDPAAFFD